MKFHYEIILWIGSACPDLYMENFYLDEAEKALIRFKENVAIAQEYLKNNPDDKGLPYISISKIKGPWREDCIQYGDGTYLFDFDFADLPKYIQKKCAALIEYDRSNKKTNQ